VKEKWDPNLTRTPRASAIAVIFLASDLAANDFLSPHRGPKSRSRVAAISRTAYISRAEVTLQARQKDRSGALSDKRGE